MRESPIASYLRRRHLPLQATPVRLLGVETMLTFPPATAEIFTSLGMACIDSIICSLRTGWSRMVSGEARASAKHKHRLPAAD